MGCASSTSGQNPGGSDDTSMARPTFDKRTGQPVTVQDAPERKDDFMNFESKDEAAGDQRMAVLPFMACIVEPSNHNPVNKQAPSTVYSIDYIHGYACEKSRQNIFFGPNNTVIYPAAAVGVVQSIGSLKQGYFGGGVVDNKAKNVSADDQCHTDDILCLNVRDNLVATGQVGSSPSAFIWDAQSQQKIQRFKVPKGGRGVRCISISIDGSECALVDMSNNHNVYVFDIGSGSQKFTSTGDSGDILDVCYTQQQGQNAFVTAGVKHIKFWNTGNNSGDKALLGGKGELTNYLCAAYDSNGVCFVGGLNGQIYVFRDNKNLDSTMQAHKGSVQTLTCRGTTLVSGGKDGLINIYDTNSLSVSKSFSVQGVPKGIDINSSGQVVYGNDKGQINVTDGGSSNKPVNMSHCQGEVWGLTILSSNKYATTCDDNNVYVWSTNNPIADGSAIVSREERKVKRPGASTLSKLADSQCARAIAFNPSNGHVAVGHNDGTMTVRSGADSSGLGNVIASNNNSREWIEVMSYSPDGSRLAVGSHDNNIYIYDSSSYSLQGTLKGHNSFILSVDWSADSSQLRSVCGAYELLFWTAGDFKQDKGGASNMKDTVWATNTAKFGWLVEGIWPSGTDYTHINGVDFSSDGSLICTADDYGLVNLFNNPARPGSKPISFRGHSEHVVRAKFMANDNYIISVGGYDQCVIRWKRS